MPKRFVIENKNLQNKIKTLDDFLLGKSNTPPVPSSRAVIMYADTILYNTVLYPDFINKSKILAAL